MRSINVKIIIGTLAAPNAKLNKVKKMTANIEKIQKMPLDFFVASHTPPFTYLFNNI